MDTFFDCVAARTQEPRAFPPLHAGHPSPAARSAGRRKSAGAHRRAKFRRELRLLCLDEFHVTDIGDAMLMRNLLAGLFEHGTGPGNHVQPASGRTLSARPATRPVPAGDRTAQAAPRRRAGRRRHGLSAACAGEGRRLSLSARCRCRSRDGADFRIGRGYRRQSRCRSGNRRTRLHGQACGAGCGVVRIRGRVRWTARPGRLHRARETFPHRPDLAACGASLPETPIGAGALPGWWTSSTTGASS